MNPTGSSNSKRKTSGAGDKDNSAENKKGRTPLKEHSNPLVRSFAKLGYTVWIIVMAVGISLAFIVSIFLL